MAYIDRFAPHIFCQSSKSGKSIRVFPGPKKDLPFIKIGSWTLHPDDRFVMGNFSGQQNRAELAVYNCKTAMMCLLEMRYGRLMTLGKLHEKNIDDWPLSNTSLAKSGRFMPLQRDQLLVQFISPTPAFALLDFDSGRWRRLCVNMNRVDNFMLSREDCTLIGKFDPTAPDTDFIFVYSPTSMSLMAWSTSSQQLSCLWQTDAALRDSSYLRSLSIFDPVSKISLLVYYGPIPLRIRCYLFV